MSLFKLPDFPVANHGHGKSKSLIHVFSIARQEADLLVPLEPYKFPIKGQRFKEIIKKQLRICFNDIVISPITNILIDFVNLHLFRRCIHKVLQVHSL